jgi:hypothetical protein
MSDEPMSDEHTHTTCKAHCELVVRLAEWRGETDKKIEALVRSTGNIKNAILILGIFLLVNDQAGKLLDVLAHLFK